MRDHDATRQIVIDQAASTFIVPQPVTIETSLRSEEKSP
jgi:hypothetical protein